MQPRFPPWLGRNDVRIGMITLAALTVTLFFFAPRFVYWRALDTSITTAEVARAGAARAQLAHPFVRFDDHTNRISSWRRFFPLVGRTLHLPFTAYLALPHLGCVATLAMAAWVLGRQGFDALSALAALVVVATGSWFFVSTGWLGYFDSWFVLGLMVVTFAPPGWCAIVAALITPWIDERFVLALPLALALRVVYRRTLDPTSAPQRATREGVLIATALLPWLAIRLSAFLFGTDPATRGYLRELLAYQAAIPTSHYALGLWHGIRWGWVLVLAAVYFLPRTPPWQRTAIGLLLALTIAVNLVVAEDLSRSVAILAPVVLFGAVAWARQHPVAARRAVFATAGLNLAFPALHVSGRETWPVRYMYAELDRLRDPPWAVNPNFYTERAVAAVNRGNIPEGFALLTRALELDPEFAEARGNRAVLQYRLGRPADAMRDIEIALRGRPTQPDFLQTRGTLRAEAGDTRGAMADIEASLRVAPRDWPSRSASEQMLQSLRSRGNAR